MKRQNKVKTTCRDILKHGAILTVGLICVAIFPSGCKSSQSSGPSQRGDVVEDWETTNNIFRIRVTAFEEKGVLLPGTYYLFQSAAVGTDSWHEIMTLRHDDRPRIPRDQVRFINGHIGYVFMIWMYAVTRDGGATWSIWDGPRDVPDWQWTTHGVIQEVQIAANGIGVMTLNPIRDPKDPGKPVKFQTKDYGQHWTLE